jgi:hypothetical protein
MTNHHALAAETSLHQCAKFCVMQLPSSYCYCCHSSGSCCLHGSRKAFVEQGVPAVVHSAYCSQTCLIPHQVTAFKHGIVAALTVQLELFITTRDGLRISWSAGSTTGRMQRGKDRTCCKFSASPETFARCLDQQ